MRESTSGNRQSAAHGAAAERLACRFLQRRGMALQARNFRTRYGEIDLVMRDSQCTVFVEVRQRRNRYYGGAAASVTPAKQRRLARAAAAYLQHYAKETASRFDVVEIYCSGGEIHEINWIRSAFTASDQSV